METKHNYNYRKAIQLFGLQSLREDIPLVYEYSKKRWVFNLIRAILVGVCCLIANTIVIICYYLCSDTQELIKFMWFITMIFSVLNGLQFTKIYWNEFIYYDTEIKFFKKWAENKGVCGLGKKNDEIYMVFDMQSVEGFEEEAEEFDSVYRINGPVLFMRTCCNDRKVEDIISIIFKNNKGLRNEMRVGFELKKSED